MKKPLRAFLSVLAAPLGAGACQHATPAPLDIGDPAPALGVSTTQPTLIWVFHTESCLNCELVVPATMVRVLDHQFRADLSVVAVAIGQPGDRDIVNDFLGRHRIGAVVVTASKRQYARRFGESRAPALYLAYRDVIVDMVDLRDAGAQTPALREASARLRRWMEDVTQHGGKATSADVLQMRPDIGRDPPANGAIALRARNAVRERMIYGRHPSPVVLDGVDGALERARPVRSGQGETVILSNTQKGVAS